MRHLLLGGFLLAAGCDVGLAPEEKAVADHLRDAATTTDRIAFERWGPHDLTGKCAPRGDPFPFLGNTAKVVRVVYTQGRERHDFLFALNDNNAVLHALPTDMLGGNGWQETLAKLRRDFPRRQ